MEEDGGVVVKRYGELLNFGFGIYKNRKKQIMRVLYSNGKWDGVWNNPKYEEIRNKIKETFSGLVFIEEGHKYFLNGKQMTCVSDVTHMFQEHFDSESKAVETSQRNFDNPKSKYYRMTPEMILEKWKSISTDACTTGTFRHEFGESCFYYMTGQYDKILPDYQDRLTDDGGFIAYEPKEEAVVRFYEDIPECIVPILAETKVYDEELGYSGTFDILFYYDAELEGKTSDKSGLVIMDWKTNRDLYKNFMGKTLLYPFNELLDMPLSIYKLQLSLYQNCLNKIGLKVVARRILWLKPDGTYDKINLEEYVGVLREELKNKDLKPRNHD